MRLKIVTFSPKTLGYTGELPENCEVRWRMPLQEFLELISGSLFVVVPLQEKGLGHGHTTIVQALRLGKAVVTTKDVGVDDYVTDGQEGILVSPGDVAGYRQTIIRLLTEPEVRVALEQHARAKAQDLTYEAFARRLVALGQDLLAA